jgi:hypothetical protein
VHAEGSLPCSQQSVSGPYPEPVESSPSIHIILIFRYFSRSSMGVFPWRQATCMAGGYSCAMRTPYLYPILLLSLLSFLCYCYSHCYYFYSNCCPYCYCYSFALHSPCWTPFCLYHLRLDHPGFRRIWTALQGFWHLQG